MTLLSFIAAVAHIPIENYLLELNLQKGKRDSHKSLRWKHVFFLREAHLNNSLCRIILSASGGRASESLSPRNSIKMLLEIARDDMNIQCSDEYSSAMQIAFLVVNYIIVMIISRFSFSIFLPFSTSFRAIRGLKHALLAATYVELLIAGKLDGSLMEARSS